MKIKIATYRRYKVHFFVFLVLIILSIILFKQEVSVVSKGSNIATIISAVISFLGIFGIIYQLDRQSKKEKTELILKLSADFYNNENHMKVFELLEKGDLNRINSNIRNIIIENNATDNELISYGQSNSDIAGIKEIYLNSYMNFFNSLAILVEDKVVELDKITKLFRYQLEKTFASIAMIEYMQEYGFDRIKKILPENFFFYGLLINAEERGKIDELKDIHPFLINKKEINIYNYSIEKTGTNGVYKGLIKQKLETIRPIKGSLVGIKEDANWYKLFKELDEFEEVGVLYDRCIELLDGNNYAWVYMKRKEEA